VLITVNILYIIIYVNYKFLSHLCVLNTVYESLKRRQYYNYKNIIPYIPYISKIILSIAVYCSVTGNFYYKLYPIFYTTRHRYERNYLYPLRLGFDF